MSADWAKLETHVVNGVFPLQRCVGSSDRSAVFLTQSTHHAPSAVALKLIPFDPLTAATQLERWRTATQLSHPGLVRLFEAGECQIDGQAYLYARMEFAEQTLAQVLERRALTEGEVREMLVPALDALDYLHQNGLVQGDLTPSNVLVVGDALKLASDSVREIDDRSATVASDIHALGVTVCEALTRESPSPGGALPPGLPPSLRDLIARCVAQDPQGRPDVNELRASLHAEAPTIDAPVMADPAATRLVIRVELPPERLAPAAPAPTQRASRKVPLAIGAALLIALGALTWSMLSRDEVALPDPPQAAVVQSNPAPTATAPALPVEPPAAEPSAAPEQQAVVEEVMPDVSRGALDTIRGTVRVAVRVSVDGSGGVIGATAHDAGPSRYFERKSLEAAKRWKFAPATAEERRSMLIRFAFTRAGVTGSAAPLP